MKRAFQFKSFFVILCILFSCSSFAQNQPIPQSLVVKITNLQQLLRSESERVFLNEIGYSDYVKGRYLDYTTEGREEFIAGDENRIKKIFTYLVFDRESNSFPKVCFEIVHEEEDERIEECQSSSWDGKTLSVFNSGKSFDLNDKDGEVFEFSSVSIFEFDSQKNYLKVVELRVAG